MPRVGASAGYPDRDVGSAERAAAVGRPLEFGSKVGASVAVVAVAAGLIAFAHLGAFRDGNDPFPHSVIAPTR
jgi:hypothetical protein